MALLFHLATGDIGGEGARIDRHIEAAIKMRHRADVILVGVGDENPLQLIGALRQPADVGHNQIHAGGGVHVGKGHAQIH